MRVITISREYGSGGGEIAARLAQQLDWELGDHAVVERMAQELGIAPEEAEARDEHVEGLVVRMLAALQVVGPVPVELAPTPEVEDRDRKSTRLNSSHQIISHAVFSLKK